ncbi:MAG: zinc-finger domain-containing protein [Alphaproteobacteria bacterium]|nr:zinc-finger domain-containing protein [Alphaproteobacteria bacterium]
MFETIEISNEEVTCDGGGGALGHPRVFLHIDHARGEKVVCPYCSRTYVLHQPRSGTFA